MFSIRFPIPLSSLTSIVQGMKNVPEPSFVQFRNHLIYTDRKNLRMDGKAYEVDQCFITTPHFFTIRTYGCPRLYAHTEMMNGKYGQYEETIREILQIEDMFMEERYNVLIHTEREKNKRKTVLFHKKYYSLTKNQIHQLIFP